MAINTGRGKSERRPTKGSVRIIGGHLRGSKLPVSDIAGLRPSADRVRETLFNWLRNDLAGARVLDLFAGSGALGFEAISRGAKTALLLEQHTDVVNSLRDSAQRLKLENLQVLQADALVWLQQQTILPFDLVFVDPPFDTEFAQLILGLLASRLPTGSKVYLETALSQSLQIADSWQLLRQGQTQQVHFRLFQLQAMA